VTLTVDRILYEGAVISIDKKTFDVKATGTLTAEVDTDLNATLALLASTALAPTNPALFDAAKQAEVKAEDRDPAAMRATLDAVLAKRGLPPPTRNGRWHATTRSQQMSYFAEAAGRARGTQRTFAEPAIDYLLTAGNCSNQVAAKIAFQDPPNGAKLLANSTRDRSGRRVISVSPGSRGAGRAADADSRS